MSSPRVRIGFVGVGGMGQAAHLRNYASPSLAGDCEVVALAERLPDLAKKVAAHYGIAKVYSDYEEMLAHEKLDALVASQPFVRHGQLIPELARAGLPIFTEKPIAASIDTGERIVQALKKNRTWAMVGYHKRSDPATIHAKRAIEEFKASGELGKLNYIRISMPVGDWMANGFKDRILTDDPVGVLEKDPAPSDMDKDTYKTYTDFVNYYIHQINLLRHLAGEPYTVSYADPARVLLIAHTVSGVPCTIEMDAYETTRDWHETVFVAFRKGYVKLELPAPLAFNRAGRVQIFKDPGGGADPVTLSPTLPWIHAMHNQALNFIKAVRGEAPAPCLAPEALEDLKIARRYIRLLKGG